MSSEKQQAANKAEKPSQTPGKAEVSEAELEKVSGGNIGSQSSGAGAGKVTFNPFSITRKIDIPSN
jgi:hypothetical protein